MPFHLGENHFSRDKAVGVVHHVQLSPLLLFILLNDWLVFIIIHTFVYSITGRTTGRSDESIGLKVQLKTLPTLLPNSPHVMSEARITKFPSSEGVVFVTFFQYTRFTFVHPTDAFHHSDIHVSL